MAEIKVFVGNFEVKGGLSGRITDVKAVPVAVSSELPEDVVKEFVKGGECLENPCGFKFDGSEEEFYEEMGKKEDDDFLGFVKIKIPMAKNEKGFDDWTDGKVYFIPEKDCDPEDYEGLWLATV